MVRMNIDEYAMNEAASLDQVYLVLEIDTHHYGTILKENVVVSNLKQLNKIVREWEVLYEGTTD